MLFIESCNFFLSWEIYFFFFFFECATKIKNRFTAQPEICAVNVLYNS